MGRASDPNEEKEDRKYQASIRAADRLLARMGKRLEQLDRWADDPPDGETWITEVRFKTGSAFDEGVLAMIKVERGAEKLLAFHVADGLGEALVGLVSRLENGTLKWKEDKPYDERNMG